MADFRDLKNASFAFYKEYMNIAYTGGYDKLNREFLSIVNRTSKRETIKFGSTQCEQIKDGIKTGKASHSDGSIYQRTFKVTYPGTLIGSGYPHITGKMTGEIQNGFCFDYISGAPYFPGSSLKGVIEDPFERALTGRKAEKEGYSYYLRKVIKDVTQKEITEKDIKYIWKQSFQGILPDSPEKTESMFNRDVFFDAYIVGVDKSPYNQQEKLVGEDVITPHESSLKEPIPITVLRLMPGVKLEFTMFLHRVKNDSGSTVLTAKEKFDVFCEIIKDMGIGSRTNLGYGVLESVYQKK